MIDPAASFADLSVPTVIACLTKLGMRSRYFTDLRPISTAQPRVCGTAFTVRTIPVREDLRDATNTGKLPNLHRRALAAAQPGQVIVFDSDNSAGYSPLGDILAQALHQSGVRGFVTDSGVSDIPGITEVGFPVFCRGSAPVPGTVKFAVADWNLPIGCSGVAVFPGDIILGDATGAVCIPQEIAEEIATMARKQELLESFILKRIRDGHPIEGTYPPDATTLAAFETWKQRRS
ncbi:hypothetical protein AAFN86_29390 [Roseomonas sp. CAU 1739]|uniref:RraA family protein n=1 Tax=Roseomonas sp. CAU 1739 TaxID=3140364 RepID=UPI00325B407C